LSFKSVLSKYLTIKTDNHIINFWIGFVGILGSLVIIILFGISFDISWLILLFSLIIGVSTFYGNYFMFKAYENITLIETLSLNFLSLFLSFIFGYFLIHNSFGILDAIGCIILIVFNIYYVKKKINDEEERLAERINK